MAASSEAGFMMSDAVSRRHAGFPSSSSARPRGPPSESIGGQSDDEGDGFADDQVPRSSRVPEAGSIARVEDRIGLLVQEHFEAFIERYSRPVQCPAAHAVGGAVSNSQRAYCLVALSKIPSHQVPQHQALSRRISTTSLKSEACEICSSQPSTSTINILRHGRMAAWRTG
jgi:hypothetical protein